MELEDISYSDEDVSTADGYDEVKPFTPSSSPESDRGRGAQVKSKPKATRTNLKNIKSSRSDGRFVELDSESDEPASTPVVGKPRPIWVMPKETEESQKGARATEEHIEHKRVHREKQRSKSKKPTKADDRESKAGTTETAENGWPGDLTGIFDIEGTTCDVTMKPNGIKWSPVDSGLTTSKKKSRKKSKDCSDGKFQLKYEDIIGQKIKRQRKGKQTDGEGICLGIAIQTFEERENGRLKSKILMFSNPSQDICMEWARRIEAVIKGFTHRPKRVKVFLQPYAGKKVTRSIYKKEVLPLFEMAELITDYTEVNHTEHIKHEIIHMDAAGFDCIVCVGGDGTVTKVVSHLLTKTQKDNSIELQPSYDPVPACLPVGIIPTGTFNHICRSVQGVDDLVTATLHILLGHVYPCDICSIYTSDKLYGWAFNSHYGFFGSVLRLVRHFTAFGDRKVHAALVRALNKSKYRNYECEVKFIPYTEDSSHNPLNGQECRQGCTKCSIDTLKSVYEVPIFDEVQSLNPLNESTNSSNVPDVTNEGLWKTYKGEYASVSILSTPELSDLSPLGMSRNAHLTDGCLDLILVRNVGAKEFSRYLKRHVKPKDQLQLSFVEAIRCTEVQFHARNINSWSHKDYSYNEILDEVKKSETTSKHGLHRADSIEVIDDISDDLEHSEEDSEEDEDVITETSKHDTNSEHSMEKLVSARKAKDVPRGKKPKAFDDPNQVDMFCVDSQHSSPTSLGYVNENFQENRKKKAQEKLARDADMLLHVSPDYRPTLTEQENARRIKAQRKHDQKKKDKDNAKRKSLWSIDSEMVSELNLHFRVHRGLVRLCGQGIPVQFEPNEIKASCIHIL